MRENLVNVVVNRRKFNIPMTTYFHLMPINEKNIYTNVYIPCIYGCMHEIMSRISNKKSSVPNSLHLPSATLLLQHKILFIDGKFMQTILSFFICFSKSYQYNT